jgi:tetratricopeptide (TPR) repeat protein
LAQTDRAIQVFDRVLNDPHADFKTVLGVAQAYRQLALPDRSVQTLERVLNDPGVSVDAVLGVAQMYNEMANWPKLEAALEKLIKFTPQNPEASYDLARLKLVLGKTAESLQALGHALDLSAQRLRRDPTASNLLENARKDPTFNALRQSPEFLKLVPPQ